MGPIEEERWERVDREPAPGDPRVDPDVLIGWGLVALIRILSTPRTRPVV